MLTQLEVCEGKRRGLVYLDPEVGADALVVAFFRTPVAFANDAPDLNQFFERAVFAEEVEGERSRVGRI